MKKIRKIFSLILSLIILLSVNVIALADEQEDFVTVRKVILNEFEVLQKITEKPTSVLIKEGYTEQQIDTIRNYKEIYRKHITELNKLSDDILQLNGYTADKIEDIRNFRGTDAEMMRLGATVTLRTSTSNFRYDGNYTRGTLSYEWSWSGVPLFKMNDMVAVSWNDWIVESNGSTVYYYGLNSGILYTTAGGTYTQDGNGTRGAGHKFKVSMSDNNYYAKQGSGYFDVRSDVHSKKDFYYYMEYGHTQLISSISFSVGVGGGDASISFSIGVSTEAVSKGNRRL